MADRRSVCSAALRRPILLGVLLGLTAPLQSPCFAQGTGTPPKTADAQTYTLSRMKSTVLVRQKGILGWKPATPGMPLQDGDRLMGGADDAVAEVDCPDPGPGFMLNGRFLAKISAVSPAATPQEKSKCVLDLSPGSGSGSGTATTPPDAKQTAEMRNQGIAMTSTHTQFGISLQGDPKDKDVMQTVAYVLDGTAICKDETGKTWTVESGSQLDLKTRARSTIDSKHLDRLATAFTSLDLSQNDTADPAVRDQLHASWLAVLSRPSDASARVELAEIQSKAQIHASRVSQYQRARAGTLATQSANPELIQKYNKLNMTKQSEVPKPQAERPKPPSGLAIHDQVATPDDSR